MGKIFYAKRQGWEKGIIDGTLQMSLTCSKCKQQCKQVECISKYSFRNMTRAEIKDYTNGITTLLHNRIRFSCVNRECLEK